VAIVTGASMGLGRAFTDELARDGWDLVIDARHRVPLDAAAAGLRGHGGTVVAIAGDVTDPAHRRALIDAASDLGPVRLLVNNASTLGPSPLPRLADHPLDALLDVYATNLVAPLALVQLALPALTETGGTVVDITSDAAVEGYEGWGGYGSSKAALDQLGNVLAAEHPDLRVYSFDPGDMRTQMHQDAFPGEDISDRPEPEEVAPVLRRLVTEAPPSGRYRAADLRSPA
jgi:NAD(P)-dependent dehydrogenase (short-subunit alcohol dehydrogenase family)